jgi:hypothetical protein
MILRNNCLVADRFFLALEAEVIRVLLRHLQLSKQVTGLVPVSLQVRLHCV